MEQEIKVILSGLIPMTSEGAVIRSILFSDSININWLDVANIIKLYMPEYTQEINNQ